MTAERLYKKDGIALHYYEIENDFRPLVLIHAQGVDAKSFEAVWAPLSKKYHVYSVDCYGHGKSLHDAVQYNVADMGRALIRFLEDVVKEKAFVLGHSSGGLIAAYIASHTELCSHLILEDPPFFLPREKGESPPLTMWIYQRSATISSTNQRRRILYCITSAINMHGISFRRGPEKGYGKS